MSSPKVHWLLASDYELSDPAPAALQSLRRRELDGAVGPTLCDTREAREPPTQPMTDTHGHYPQYLKAMSPSRIPQTFQGPHTPSTVGVLSVATGVYLDYWMLMMESADSNLFLSSRVHATVFTDRGADAVVFARRMNRISVHVVTVPPLGWPEATLFRYELFSRNWEEIDGDLLVYLDADMRIARATGDELFPASWPGGVALVAHPGYFRTSRPWMYRLERPRVALSDVSRILHGERGIGQWEKRKTSLAYVPPRLRKIYVCGGVWFGMMPKLMDLIHELSERTRIDYEKGVLARWHDESYLNWWAARNEHEILGSEYCHDERVKRCDGVTPRIIAVDKAIRVRD